MSTEERPQDVTLAVHAQVHTQLKIFLFMCCKHKDASTQNMPLLLLCLNFLLLLQYLILHLSPSIQFLAAPMSDKGRVVAVNADLCPLCAQTMRIFTAAYGAEAGVAGLKWLPYGGKYGRLN